MAPYGRAAQAVLRAHGLWDSIRPRLVLGENVALWHERDISHSSVERMIGLV